LPNQTNSVAGIGLAVMTPHVIRGATHDIAAVVPAAAVSVVATGIVSAVVVTPIVITAVVIIATIVVPVIVVPAIVVSRTTVITAGRTALPFEIEGITLGSSLGVLNMNDGSPAVGSRITN